MDAMVHQLVSKFSMAMIETVLLIYTIIDIDECSEGIDRCAQNCHNAVGSYACSCDDGYRINEDGRTCNGKVLYIVAIIIYNI